MVAPFIIFGMGTLKISYTWSFRGLLPDPLCLFHCFKLVFTNLLCQMCVLG